MARAAGLTPGRALTAAAIAALLVGGCAVESRPAPSPVVVGAPSPPAAPTSTPTATAAPTPAPAPTSTPGASPTPIASSSPAPTPGGAVAAGPAGRPTRVAIPALRIDLPVVTPPRGSTWPLCDVAEYFRPPTFQHPGTGGVTYVYAHAQRGMFLPILEASQLAGGRALVGAEVRVWTASDQLFTYEITRVRRHQKNLAWAYELPPNSLVLQTSETQYRTGGKVMLEARQVGRPVAATPDEARPPAHPRVCGH